MAKYINKDALITELERLIKIQPTDEFQPKEQNKIDWLAGKSFTINSLEVFLDTIEVKEVDLEKEVELWYDEYAGNYRFDWNGFAKHFFELGMSVSNEAQKGEGNEQN